MPDQNTAPKPAAEQEETSQEGTTKPTKLGEPPYAGGSDIHVGPGQETNLPHESWNVEIEKKK